MLKGTRISAISIALATKFLIYLYLSTSKRLMSLLLPLLLLPLFRVLLLLLPRRLLLLLLLLMLLLLPLLLPRLPLLLLLNPNPKNFAAVFRGNLSVREFPSDVESTYILKSFVKRFQFYTLSQKKSSLFKGVQSKVLGHVDFFLKRCLIVWKIDNATGI